MIEPQLIAVVALAGLQFGAVIYALIMLTKIARNVQGQSDSLQRIATALERERTL